MCLFSQVIPVKFLFIYLNFELKKEIIRSIKICPNLDSYFGAKLCLECLCLQASLENNLQAYSLPIIPNSFYVKRKLLFLFPLSYAKEHMWNGQKWERMGKIGEYLCKEERCEIFISVSGKENCLGKYTTIVRWNWKPIWNL